MTTKRFYLLNYNNHPIYDSLTDKEYNAQFKKQREKICDLLNEIDNTNKDLTEKNHEITKLIMEYDTTNKYSEKNVINKIKDIIENNDDGITKRFEFKFNDEEYVYFYINDNETRKKYKYLIDDELLKLMNDLAEENNKLKQEIKGFESCSHNWNILYDEAKNKVEELNKELKHHSNKTRKELPKDKNGYNKIICPMCNSDLKYNRFIGYMNGEQYEEFDCTQCDFTGRIRKGNLWE